MTGDGNSARDTVPQMDVATALGTYLEIVDATAPGLVEGLYVVGSYALDDWVEGVSDIDVVVVTADPATDEDFRTLVTAHALLAEHQPLPHIDGPYLAWGDLVVEPATGLHRPWTLQGELHHDGECFEINPVTWYTLATYGVTVRGPRPERIGIPTDVEARVRWVVGNLQSYWRETANSVLEAVARPTPPQWNDELLAWCALGPLRLHYTAFTGDVTSKRGAGQYGLQVAPAEFHGALDAAMAARACGGKAGVPVTSDTMAVVGALMDWCIRDVTAAADPRA